MSIAAAKRRRRQVAKGNRHLAKLGRPGVPKKLSAEASSRKLARLISGLKTRAARKGASGR